MQAIKLITRSLRLLRVVDANEAPEAKDAETALEALNQLMVRWEADGVALGWSELEDVSQEMTVPFESIRAITYNLAAELRLEYGVALDGKLEQVANQSYKVLLRDVLAANPLSLSVRMRGGMWDIYTDSFGPRRY